MEPIGWRQPTGTFSKKGHPQFIEVRAAKVHGADQYGGQVGPSCFRRWCPEHREFMRNENSDKAERRDDVDYAGPSASNATCRWIRLSVSTENGSTIAARTAITR